MEDLKLVKTLRVIYASSIRQLVENANALAIKKDDIVNILPSGEEYILIYYK